MTKNNNQNTKDEDISIFYYCKPETLKYMVDILSY